jgi:hypothetical protein
VGHRRRPTPPRPDLVRTPTGPYGWLDARLLREGWLARLGPDGTAVLAFLALAADQQGVSFYGRARIAHALAIDRGRLDKALHQLLADGLVAFRPWHASAADGVWQLLPTPGPVPVARSGRPTVIGDVVSELLRRRAERGS